MDFIAVPGCRPRFVAASVVPILYNARARYSCCQFSTNPIFSIEKKTSVTKDARRASRDARRWRLAGAAGGPLVRRSAPARDLADRPLDAHSDFRASKPTTRPCTPLSFSRCCKCPCAHSDTAPTGQPRRVGADGAEAGLPVARHHPLAQRARALLPQHGPVLHQLFAPQF